MIDKLHWYTIFMNIYYNSTLFTNISYKVDAAVTDNLYRPITGLIASGIRNRIHSAVRETIE